MGTRAHRVGCVTRALAIVRDSPTGPEAKPPAVRCPDCRRIIGYAQLVAGVGVWWCWHCKREVWLEKHAA